MPLTFNSVNIVLIFWPGKRFKSKCLSTSITIQLMSRQAVESGLELSGRY